MVFVASNYTSVLLNNRSEDDRNQTVSEHNVSVSPENCKVSDCNQIVGGYIASVSLDNLLCIARNCKEGDRDVSARASENN